MTIASRQQAGQPEPADASTASAAQPRDRIDVLDHGFVRLDAVMADDLSVANAARVSFARRKEVLDDADRGLIRFLMRDRHGTPFEHNSFRFHIRCPIFVAREWMRHRIGCLTGDTVVTFVSTDGHASPQLARTLDELWSMWTVGGQDGARGVRGMSLRVLDESTNEFTVGHIEDVVDKGVQPVYRVTLANGRQLTATENHRVLTDGGWTTLGKAVGLVGAADGARMTKPCRLVTNGMPVYSERDWMDVPGPVWRGRTLTGHPVDVVRVESVGMRRTYDLCVAGPWHNFVANGIVVHNSFNEFSLRYAKATDDFYVPEADDVRTQVGKPGAYTFEPVSGELAEHTREELRKVYDVAYATYQGLLEQGVAREVARSVLPVGAYTEFYWTVNARSLMNFVSLRAAETAQREIRRYAEAVEELFARYMPVTHEAFVANNRQAP